ncbi:tail assembly protein [Escherichia coli]|uniref:tail assembly protein n=1 Tax=Escherichia coli TaxID=562 RepID=UPI000A4BACF0|nr:tail assembly protein [Escherichia coli]
MNTAAEAIRALSLQMPGFRRQMNEGWYQIRIAGRDAGENELSARLNEPLANGAVLHIVPRLAGAKSGGVFQTVLGAALVAAAIWMPGISIAASNIMFSVGAAMALGGVAQLLAPKPKTPEYNSADNGKQNTYFSSLDNMIAQGNPMPVPYGEMLVGSRRISQDVSTRDEGGDGTVVVIGRQG